eukprot:Hpha_TRINITY_DN6_c0_g1::TRINITY_DN6_c0_g1_i1::g.110069::m.110069
MDWLDGRLLLCLLANSVATVIVLAVADFLNRKQRGKEVEWRIAELRLRMEEERRGWASECGDVIRRIRRLESAFLSYQQRMLGTFRSQVCDHQGYIDKRIEGLRYDITAAKLSAAERHGWSHPSVTASFPPPESR